MALKIVLTGGGTGGHLVPLLVVAEEIRKTKPETQFLFLGPKGKIEQELFANTGIKVKEVLSGKIRRYFSWLYLVDLLKFPIGLIQALWHLFWYLPDVVFAKGGYASVPVVLAARIYGIPTVIHESDAVPGIANRFLGSIANRIALNFERAKIYFPTRKVFLSGIPVQEQIRKGNAQTAKAKFGSQLDSKPVLLILGGSQGARIINRTIVKMIDQLIKRFQILHQTGKTDFEVVCAAVEQKGYKIGRSDYHPFAFASRQEMADYLALADVVISRAGATSIAELAANKKACILVPILASANNHQQINAFEISREKGAVTIEESNFTPSIILSHLEKMIADESYRKSLGENIFKFYNPDSAAIIAEEIFQLEK